MCDFKLNTKSTKSFGKLRMTAQSLTKNVAIEEFENVLIRLNSTALSPLEIEDSTIPKNQ